MVGLIVLLVSAGTAWALWQRSLHPSFVWGVGLNPTPTGVLTAETTHDVVERARTLGVNTIRVKYTTENEQQRNRVRWAVTEARTPWWQPLQIVMILEHNDLILNGPEPYQAGYDLGLEAASTYRGQVAYYQLGNELAAYALKPTWGGFTPDSYIPEKYERGLTWLRGVSDGIHAGDPKAKRLVTGHWLQHAFWEMAKDDGLAFEAIGWDWFHEELPVPSLVDFEFEEKPYDLIGKLASIAETVWVTEAGVNGDVVGRSKAAAFLTEFITELRTDPRIDGVFVAQLTDEMHNQWSENWQHGLIGIEPVDLANQIWRFSDTVRPEYRAYDALIHQTN